MKILITGGAGFIGSHLARSLLAQGHAVVVLDNLKTGSRNAVPEGARFIEGDIRHGGSLLALLEREKPDVICHLAAQVNVRYSLSDPVGDAEVNILGSLSLFEAARAARIGRIIAASSGGAIYGEGGDAPSNELDPTFPLSPYGIAKKTMEEYGHHWDLQTGGDFVALRLANVYGPGQNPAGEAGVVSLFIERMTKGLSPAIFGDGNQVRDFIWVGDVVRAFELALLGPPGVYNIGSGVGTSVNGIFLNLKHLLSFPGEATRLPSNPGEIRRNVLAIDKARDHLGWQPHLSLEAGMLRTVASETSTAFLGRRGGQVVPDGDSLVDRPPLRRGMESSSPVRPGG